MKVIDILLNNLYKPETKKGKFTAQPQYPCFGQDLGDSAGAGNLPLQRYETFYVATSGFQKKPISGRLHYLLHSH
ncbi:hypothetical protein [Emticicia sp. TH156]|uniref:hypothetical protein n=1 Tax=Emticicia sp. TH156 TaxID=2067454 RepID=UPI000C780DC3|nr:hypothetical protein [Emticicia sp. TH156]PLK45528.1 hypothetical protein C0V77_05175 [Emticicia sp. TH156]